MWQKRILPAECVVFLWDQYLVQRQTYWKVTVTCQTKASGTATACAAKFTNFEILIIPSTFTICPTVITFTSSPCCIKCAIVCIYTLWKAASIDHATQALPNRLELKHVALCWTGISCNDTIITGDICNDTFNPKTCEWIKDFDWTVKITKENTRSCIFLEYADKICVDFCHVQTSSFSTCTQMLCSQLGSFVIGPMVIFFQIQAWEVHGQENFIRRTSDILFIWIWVITSSGLITVGKSKEFLSIDRCRDVDAGVEQIGNRIL